MSRDTPNDPGSTTVTDRVYGGEKATILSSKDTSPKYQESGNKIGRLEKLSGVLSFGTPQIRTSPDQSHLSGYARSSSSNTPLPFS